MTEEQIATARNQPRAKELREWRLALDMNKYKDIRKKFDDAGIDLRILCFNMTEAITDDEIDYAFRMAKALGCKALSSSTQVTVSKRTAPIADKYKMLIGFHGHDNNADPNEFGSLESYGKGLAYGKYNGINLDVGHFTAAGYDALKYIKENNKRITHLHVKDRKKDHGPNVPWGEGDTPLKEIFALLKKEKYGFPANIELEYRVPEGSTRQAEIKKCLEYAKKLLA
jgi:sugar phosphate isomerase/epimerase